MRVRLLNPEGLVHKYVTIPAGNWQLVTFENKLYSLDTTSTAATVTSYIEVPGIDRVIQLVRTHEYTEATSAPDPCPFPNH